MKTQDSQTSRADSTRARLMTAGIDAFANRGFFGTTTRDIAKTAELSTAGLYVHFASKEELLFAISEAGHKEVLQIVLAAASASNDPVEQLRRLVFDFSAYHAREHTVASIVNYELAALRPDHYSEIAATRQQIQSCLETVLRNGAASGQFDIADPQVVTVALLSLGLDVSRWFRDDGKWTPEDVAAHNSAIAMRIVGAAN